MLLGLLALGSVAVLVGSRLAVHRRRVGLLKTIGATPGLVASTFLAENLLLALIAAALGLVGGWLVAPLLTSPGAALVGTAGAPSLTLHTAAVVVAVALVVALASAVVPAVRAAHSSTVDALADAARPPKRRGWLIRLSSRLSVPALFSLRLVARRPRRALLSAATVAVTVAGIVAVLAFHTYVDVKTNLSVGRFAQGLGNPIVCRDEQMLLVITIMLVTLSVLTAIFTAWATVLDARHAVLSYVGLGQRRGRYGRASPTHRCSLRSRAWSLASHLASLRSMGRPESGPSRQHCGWSQRCSEPFLWWRDSLPSRLASLPAPP